jgi:hypothetical protein
MPVEGAVFQLFRGVSTIVVSKGNVKQIVEMPAIASGDGLRGV